MLLLFKLQSRRFSQYFVSGTLVTIFGTCFVSTGRKVTSQRVSAHAWVSSRKMEVESWSVRRFERKFSAWISLAKANQAPLWLKKCLIQKRWEKRKNHCHIAYRQFVEQTKQFSKPTCRVIILVRSPPHSGYNIWRFYCRRMGKVLQQFSCSDWKFAAGRGIYKLTWFLDKLGLNLFWVSSYVWMQLNSIRYIVF